MMIDKERSYGEEMGENNNNNNQVMYIGQQDESELISELIRLTL